MANQHIQPDALWPSAQYGFSQVVVSTGAKIIHCAGQTAWDKDMNLVGGDDLEKQMAQALENVKLEKQMAQALENVKLEKQMAQALENVKAALAAGGAAMRDVARLDIYVVDYSADKLPAVGAALSRFFDSDHLPANTLLGIQALALPEFLVEVTATAVVDG